MFTTFITSLAKIAVAPLLFTLALAGFSVAPSHVATVAAPNKVTTLGAFNPSGGGTYRLQTSVGLSDTSIRLSSFKEPISGMPYTMTYLNTSIGYGTLDPQQSTRSEFISFTGITQNSDGTATLTGVTRGLSRSYPFTASSTIITTHSGQSIFILSDSPQLFSEYAVKRNNETITGQWAFPTPTTGSSSVNKNYGDTTYAILATTTTQTFTGPLIHTASTTFTAIAAFTVPPVSTATATTPLQIINKSYADGLAIAGSPNASTTSKGIVQQATTTDINARTLAGSTAAPLFLSPNSVDAIASSSVTIYDISSSSPSVTVGLLSIPGILVDANDIVNVFGTSALNTISNVTIHADLYLFNGSATTTLYLGTDRCAANACSASGLGYFLATTSQTLRVTFDAGGGADVGHLLVQVFHR